MHKSALHFTQVKTETYKTFEHLDVRSTSTSKPLRVIVIYRSPVLAVRPFLDELSSYLSEVTMTPGNLVIVGDFNLHYEQADVRGRAG